MYVYVHVHVYVCVHAQEIVIVPTCGHLVESLRISPQAQGFSPEPSLYILLEPTFRPAEGAFRTQVPGHGFLLSQAALGGGGDAWGGGDYVG